MADALAHIRVVIFDLGGTLIDFVQPESLTTLRAGFRNAHAMLSDAGQPVPPFSSYRRVLERRFLSAYITSRIRRGELDPMVQLQRAHRRWNIELRDAELEALALRIYEPTKSISSVRQDAVEAVVELARRGYRLGVISNTIAPPPALDDQLADAGLINLFPIRVYSCVVGVPKPNPRIFRVALERMGASAAESMYIGDKPRIDVRGARRVNMATVLRTPAGKKIPPGPAPDLRIHEIRELLDVLPPLKT